MIQPDFVPKINLADYNYELPPDRIAEFPLEERSSSKLLLANSVTKKISHYKFEQLSDLVPSGSLIIINTTKVIPARLILNKPTGGLVELLLVEPVLDNQPEYHFNERVKNIDPQISLNQKGESTWLCLIGGKRVKEGLVLSVEIENVNNSLTALNNANNLILNAKIIGRNSNEAIVNFSWIPDKLTFAEVITMLGKIPLPPYIKREVENDDKRWYQTVYAQSSGSVAAPTAGFHFTGDIIKQLNKKFIKTENIVLHVGPGTFKPIEVDDVYDHEMHSERISISIGSISNIIDYLKTEKDSKIIATGTTSLRTLESLYWIGCKIIFHQNIFSDGIPTLKQWDAYEIANNKLLPSRIESFESLLHYMKENKLDEFSAKTNLFIIPGYYFKIVNGLITNYHLPKSTLILLVAAFVGKEFWKMIYESAISQDYRFLSYGDSSLITNY